eukprot:COSAG02_NODE_3584_length_6524_cov_7.274934_6_plen_281_part_00
MPLSICSVLDHQRGRLRSQTTRPCRHRRPRCCLHTAVSPELPRLYRSSSRTCARSNPAPPSARSSARTKVQCPPNAPPNAPLCWSSRCRCILVHCYRRRHRSTAATCRTTELCTPRCRTRQRTTSGTATKQRHGAGWRKTLRPLTRTPFSSAARRRHPLGLLERNDVPSCDDGAQPAAAVHLQLKPAASVSRVLRTVARQTRGSRQRQHTEPDRRSSAPALARYVLACPERLARVRDASLHRAWTDSMTPRTRAVVRASRRPSLDSYIRMLLQVDLPVLK